MRKKLKEEKSREKSKGVREDAIADVQQRCNRIVAATNEKESFFCWHLSNKKSLKASEEEERPEEDEDGDGDEDDAATEGGAHR